MVSASDHRSAGRSGRVFGLLLLPLGFVGTGVFLFDRYLRSLGIPEDMQWLGLFPLLFVVIGAVNLYRSTRHYRRAASMARIERGGVKATGRLVRIARANWSQSVKIRGGSLYTDVGSSVYHLHFAIQPAGASPFTSVAEDHLPSALEAALQRSEAPLLLDPEEQQLCAVRWDALEGAP